MKVRKAVITSAGPAERHIAVQTLIDQNGTQRTVLGMLITQAVDAGVDEICVITAPGDEVAYSKAAGDHASRIRFATQSEPLGYAHAVLCARSFVGNEPFLHLVGDHAYVRDREDDCVAALISAATQAECSVSAVQLTRENLLPYFGTIGGERLHGRDRLYRVTTVMEKPSATVAEQALRIPGLRAGFYLCFYGMHVLTPAVFNILERVVAESGGKRRSLSDALSQLAGHEQYLALEATGTRIDLGTRYGMLYAQLALALSGQDRHEVLETLVELLASSKLRSGTRHE